LERDEAHVDGRKRERLRDQRRRQRPRIDAFEHDHLAPFRQALVQLPMPDINRIDSPGAAREQDLGEAASRGAKVEACAAIRIEAEMIERGRKLHATARYPWVRRRG